jgi:hypothetical protein
MKCRQYLVNRVGQWDGHPVRTNAPEKQVDEDNELQICNKDCVLHLLRDFDGVFYTFVWKLTEI